MKSRFREGSPADQAFQEGFRAGCYFQDELVNALEGLLRAGSKDWTKNSGVLEKTEKVKELIHKVRCNDNN
ncbi:MAG: hypothetical protein HQL12_00895 [Candidatus Omnitrophica bacterium]|nr:hypothetical protein [Candidatus Omnitrophota bacterium]